MSEQHEYASIEDVPLSKLQRLAKAPTSLDRALRALKAKGHKVLGYELVNGRWVFKLERR
jgi:hypothetical protein